VPLVPFRRLGQQVQVQRHIVAETKKKLFLLVLISKKSISSKTKITTTTIDYPFFIEETK
jgi:hypothetical protein